MDNVTITKEEYIRLKIGEMTLIRLEHGGVDNWEWYGESLNPDGELSFDEMEESIRKEIKGDENER